MSLKHVVSPVVDDHVKRRFLVSFEKKNLKFQNGKSRTGSSQLNKDVT